METIELLSENYNKNNIVVTIALPVFNSQKIIWLSIESLKNQKNINFDWELIICEEQQEFLVGLDFFKNEFDNLQKIGCKRLLYLSPNNYTCLAIKWKIISENTSNDNTIFLLQASDDYSYEDRLKNTFDIFQSDNKIDWYDCQKAFFYDFNNKKMTIYNAKKITNVNIALKTNLLKKFYNPDDSKKRGIDYLIFTQINNNQKLLTYVDINLYTNGFFSDGFNTLSIHRSKLYDKWPFEKTNIKLEDLTISSNIKEKILQL